MSHRRAQRLAVPMNSVVIYFISTSPTVKRLLSQTPPPERGIKKVHSSDSTYSQEGELKDVPHRENHF